MDPQRTWARFRKLPVWGQAILWVVAWPALAALAVWRTDPAATGVRVAAAAVLLVGGAVWVPVLAGGSDTEPAVTEDGDVVAAPSASPGPTRPPAPSPSPSPSPSPPPGPSPSGSPAAAAAPSPVPAGTSTPATAATWTVVNIVDGDTIDVRSADGTRERIRIIGIDTPERGECGFTEAASALGALVLDQQVELVAGARDDRDRYDRLLRYVDGDGGDAGLALIDDGLAIARYDSRDGYGAHPREASYVAVDAASSPYTCTAPAPSPTSVPPAHDGADSGSGGTASNPWSSGYTCDPAYDPCVPPKAEVGDLNCPDIREHHPNGVRVDHTHGDPHGLDGDTDGHGCE